MPDVSDLTVYQSVAEGESALWTDVGKRAYPLLHVARIVLAYEGDPLLYHDADGTYRIVLPSLVAADLEGG